MTSGVRRSDIGGTGFTGSTSSTSAVNSLVSSVAAGMVVDVPLTKDRCAVAVTRLLAVRVCVSRQSPSSIRYREGPTSSRKKIPMIAPTAGKRAPTKHGRA
jgi:hypothetical protein